MGLLGIWGDQLYLQGLKQNNFLKFQVASYIFPFEREILIGPAQFYFRNKLADLKIYKEAIDYDPYSVQFLGVYTQLEYLAGNKNEAIIAKRKLERIAPNANVLKQIKELMKGLK